MSSTTIPANEPERVFSGDTVKWSRSFSDYSSAEYDLKYKLIGEINQELTAAADGTGFLVTVSASDSSMWAPGRYRLVGYVEKTDLSERYNVYEGELEVLFNPAFVGDDYETRSFWHRVYDNLQAIIEGKAKQNDSSYTIAGRSISKMSWDELLTAYDRAGEMKRLEEDKDKARRGESTNRNIGIRFQRPGGSYFPFKQG